MKNRGKLYLNKVRNFKVRKMSLKLEFVLKKSEILISSTEGRPKFYKIVHVGRFLIAYYEYIDKFSKLKM